MPIDYGSNDVTTSGNFVASSGSLTQRLDALPITPKLI